MKSVSEVSPIATKLPKITLWFWILKIIATTLGETGGDWFSMTLNFGYLISTVIFLLVFIFALIAQMRSVTFKPILYWSVIVATSTVGTTTSDFMDRTLGLGYSNGSAILISLLIFLLLTWRYFVGGIDVNSIRTKKAELFYWATILISNTLGTALGDYLSDDSGLGFFASWLLITGLIALTALAARFSKISHVILFWIAFILTRPFGATFGDLLTKSTEHGGLNLGTGYTSLILISILLAIIGARRKVDNARQLT